MLTAGATTSSGSTAAAYSQACHSYPLRWVAYMSSIPALLAVAALVLTNSLSGSGSAAAIGADAFAAGVLILVTLLLEAVRSDQRDWKEPKYPLLIFLTFIGSTYLATGGLIALCISVPILGTIAGWALGATIIVYLFRIP